MMAPCVATNSSETNNLMQLSMHLLHMHCMPCRGTSRHAWRAHVMRVHATVLTTLVVLCLCPSCVQCMVTHNEPTLLSVWGDPLRSATQHMLTMSPLPSLLLAPLYLTLHTAQSAECRVQTRTRQQGNQLDVTGGLVC
jgi:hypothetical protein